MSAQPIRFSIGSLLTILTIVAVIFAGVNQYRQSFHIQSLSTRVEILEQDSRIHDRVSQMFAKLDLNNERHLVAFDVAQHVVPTIPNLNSPLWVKDFGNPATLVDVDGKPGGLEMLSLQYGGLRVPGSVGYAVALYNGAQMIDVIGRKSSTRDVGLQELEFEDLNHDGKIDISIRLIPELRSKSPTTLQYIATTNGFNKIGVDTAN